MRRLILTYGLIAGVVVVFSVVFFAVAIIYTPSIRSDRRIRLDFRRLSGLRLR